MNISSRILHLLRGRAFQAILLTVCGILIQAGPAESQTLVSTIDSQSRWETIEVVEFGAIDLDVSRVITTAPGVYEVRTRWRFAKEQVSPEGQPYQSSVAVRGVDCRRGEMALISFANHNGSKVVGEESLPTYAARWEPVAPESVVGSIASRVCGGNATNAIAARSYR